VIFPCRPDQGGPKTGRTRRQLGARALRSARGLRSGTGELRSRLAGADSLGLFEAAVGRTSAPSRGTSWATGAGCCVAHRGLLPLRDFSGSNGTHQGRLRRRLRRSSTLDGTRPRVPELAAIGSREGPEARRGQLRRTIDRKSRPPPGPRTRQSPQGSEDLPMLSCPQGARLDDLLANSKKNSPHTRGQCGAEVSHQRYFPWSLGVPVNPSLNRVPRVGVGRPKPARPTHDAAAPPNRSLFARSVAAVDPYDRSGGVHALDLPSDHPHGIPRTNHERWLACRPPRPTFMDRALIADAASHWSRRHSQ
jgi:hypothetical protein